MKDLFKNYIYPIATMAGSIIGVGFLALPYIALRVGIWPMLFYFVLLTGLMVSLHVIFAQICLKTPDYKRWPGFVGFYLGKWPKAITLVLIILGSFGVLLVYLIVAGQFLNIILNPFFGGNALWYALLYFIVSSTVVYFGANTISKIEFWTLVLLFGSFFVIGIREFGHILPGNILVNSPDLFHDWKTAFLPYGVIIFSLWGIGLIPEVEEMLIGNKKVLKRVIAIGTLAPALLYLLFMLLILGISGSHTTPSALDGLKHFLGQKLFSVALFIGILSTFVAFITQGLFLKKTFMYDMGIKELPAWIFTCVPPIILFLVGFNSFISLISFIGGVVLGINGILVLLMYQKVGGKKVIIYPFMVVFVFGIIYELVFFLK